jgi:hypothetical protein
MSRAMVQFVQQPQKNKKSFSATKSKSSLQQENFMGGHEKLCIHPHGLMGSHEKLCIHTHSWVVMKGSASNCVLTGDDLLM